MSVQKPHPLIWLARIFTSSWVGRGTDESSTTLPAAVRRLTKLVPSGLAKALTRGSMSDLL
jgi:hypothetical protein